MRKWLILLSTMLVTAASGAPAWTWVDADGQVHFSDRPVPGARQVELAGAQGFGAPAARPASATATPTAAPPTANAQSPYRAINISNPAEQQTLWNIGATLSVQIEMDPPLSTAHRLDLIFDGQRRNLNTANLQLTLPNVFRGVHTLQAVVVDASGAEVMRSPTRNFIVQQNSIQNPNSPLRPGRANGG